LLVLELIGAYFNHYFADREIANISVVLLFVGRDRIKILLADSENE